MHCQRCSKEFAESELSSPSLVLRVLSVPFFWMYLVLSKETRGEFVAHYCRPCRRQLNFCLFFVAFMFVSMGTYALLLQLGIIMPAPPRPR